MPSNCSSSQKVKHAERAGNKGCFKVQLKTRVYQRRGPPRDKENQSDDVPSNAGTEQIFAGPLPMLRPHPVSLL